MTPRTSKPGSRTRKDNGPQLLNVTETPQPPLQSVGTATVYTHEVLSGGPLALIEAKQEAQRLADQFGHEFQEQWCIPTKWMFHEASRPNTYAPRNPIPPPDPASEPLTLPSDAQNPHLSKLQDYPPSRGRARAIYALQWRPVFLAVVALTRSTLLGCRAAKVSSKMVHDQRQDDPEFDTQILQAQAHAVQLLHDVTFRDALEGTLEPVLWQGITVAWVRKFDNRLRVEMLRAHMPQTFQTPGKTPAISAGSINIEKAVICDQSVLDMIQSARQENLKAYPDGTGLADPVPIEASFS